MEKSAEGNEMLTSQHDVEYIRMNNAEDKKLSDESSTIEVI